MKTEQRVTVASSKDLPTFLLEQTRVFITVYYIPFFIICNIQNVVDWPHDQVGFLVFFRS